MQNLKKRILALMLALSILAGLLPAAPAMMASAAEELVNVALNGTATTEDGNYQTNVIGNVIDGDVNTNWQTQGQWPSTAVVQLDMGRSISEVVVKLGGDDNASRTVQVTVQYAQNGVVSDLIAFGTQTVTLTGDMEARFTVDQSVSATHFFVTLSDPKQNGAVGAFWPCIAEIEIYEKQEAKLSDYNNIAAQAQITATGGKEHATDGSAKLVDGSTATLYKFYDAQLTSEQSVILTYEQARSMDAFAIAFEHVDPEPYNYAFTYSILARNGDGDYDTIVANANANRTDNTQQQYSFLEKTYSEVKIVMHSCTNNVGNGIGWPAIAEFEVYGSEAVVEDGCISNGKSVHASSGQSLAKNITDGSKSSVWRGSYYPGYVDIDLGENYYLDAVEVYTPENGYSQYSIYTSLDGRDFTKLAEKTTRDSATLETGEVYAANGVEARIVRVYMEYNSAETAAVLNEVRVLGTASGTPVQELPPIAVVDFEDSAYADLTVTAEDTYAEVYGIIQRRLGEDYKSWFTLELAESENGYDYFELSTSDGKVHVKGNDGVSLATGINHYLKYYCNVHISQVGDQVVMPATAPAIEGTVHKETKAKVRYSYNYCTLSYSMAFWGENEWRNELDWLALNGVNVVLDATAQEEVWRRFLGELGYTHAEAKDYIAGPAYYAWAYMANLSGFGGPVHDSWFEERTELARKNQQIMRNLGMQPVLQGYSGMVPTDITSKATGSYALTSGDIIAQGNWCSFQRPAMLKTTNAAFDTYAELFYQCQQEVYGETSDYYATDPFHEGGNTGGMNAADISREVLTSMLAADSDAVWIIQAWQGNPSTALLNGLDQIENGAQHALVLDLYAEKTPHNQETGNSYGDTKEFDDTPWLYCMLNNFGGRLGLHGHLDNMAAKIPEAFNNCSHIAGIGITPEASVNNPVLYDFLFETIWQDDASQPLQQIDLDTWLDAYATRRYGAASESANAAWDILKETVYKSSLNNLGQGAPESVVNARPALSINAASTWGNAVVSYDKVELEKAAKLLLADYDQLSASEAYLYDVANVLQQVLSNSAQEYQKKMAAAFNSGDLAAFEKYSATFLQIIDYMETVTATTEYFLLGRWVEQAKALGKNADDFTKELYEFNAKALVTTWGSYNQAESGGLKDYSNRQWSGLIGDFYKVRWERWITARTNELKGLSYESSINWFQWEWEWVRSNTVYTTEATPADLEALGHEIIEKFTSSNPAADASRDIDPNAMSVYAEDYEPNNATEGDPNYAKDNNPGTFWHTVWSGSDRATHYLIFTFDEVTKIDGMRFLQRTGGPNGVVTKFDLLVRESESDEWTLIVDDGTLATDATWQKVSFDAVNAKQVKFQVVDATSDGDRKFAAAAEIRFTMPKEASHDRCSYENGFCTVCGDYQSAELNTDGFYEIGNAGQLYWFARKVNAGETDIDAILTDNIVVNENLMDKITVAEDGTATVNEGETVLPWTPMGTELADYNGAFSGNNKTISGLYFNDRNASYVGLFGKVSASVPPNQNQVSNLTIADSYFCGADYVGGVAGYVDSGTMPNCHNSSTVCGTGSYVGGVAGYNERGAIYKCSNSGTIYGNNYVGGMMGYNYGSVEENFNTGDIYGTGSNIGGLIGKTLTYVYHCYNAGSVSGSTSSNYVGGLIGYNDSDHVWRSYNVGTVTGGSNVGAIVGYTYLHAAVNECYYLDTCGAGGKGNPMSEDRFVSGEVAYLLQYQQFTHYWGQKIGEEKYPVFSNDKVYPVVHCNGVTLYYSNEDIAPAEHVLENGFCTVCGGLQSGVLNEDGYYEIGNAGQLYWFADKIHNGENTINAILIDDIVVNENLMDKITIAEDGTATVNEGETVLPWTPIGDDAYNFSYMGGTFDGNGKTISGLFYNDDSWNRVGLFGYVYDGGKVQNVMVSDSYFRGRNAVGGVVGYNLGTVTNCGSLAFVKGESQVGGLVGYNQRTTVSNCYNVGTVVGNSNVGGAVGYNSGTASNCYYLDTCGAAGEGTAKTEAQFASGEVTWLLNGSTDQDELVWKQTIGTDAVPKFEGAIVSYNSNKDIYYNKSTHVHDYESVVTAPTCTEGGYTTYTCACGDSYIGDETDPLGHTDGEALRMNEVAATCTDEGSYELVTSCTVCGEETGRESFTIPALGHTEEILPAVAPTCTETGLTEGKKCSVCSETLTAQEVVPALGHDWQDGSCVNCGEKQEIPTENPFVDVKEGDFFYDAVLWAVENDITAGTTATTFTPNGQCQRAAVVTFLWRAAGKPEPETTVNPFTDVKESDFFYKAVLWGAEKGIVYGVTATTFAPYSLCTRAQVVSFLYRAANSPEVSSTAKNPFTDVDASAWYGPAVLWAAGEGIVYGISSNVFGVNNICNRAQVVSFLYRANTN